MSLTLEDRDLIHLYEIIEVLLSPENYKREANWSKAVLARIEALFETDRSALIIPQKESVKIHTENVPAKAVHALQASVLEVGPEGYRSDQSDVDAVFRSRRTKNMGAFSMLDLAKSAGLDVASTPFYQDVMLPAGIAHSVGIAASLSVGEVWLCIGHSLPTERRFTIRNEKALLNLLLPSFSSAARQLFVNNGCNITKKNLLLPSPNILIERYRLTSRQGEIALLLAAGDSDRQIAEQLFISPHTVRTHGEHIFRKLKIHSRKALALKFLSDL